MASDRHQVVLRFQQHRLDLRELRAEHAGNGVESGEDRLGGGLAKTVRSVAATVSAASVLIVLNTFRKK